jgi:hypothetical protein
MGFDPKLTTLTKTVTILDVRPSGFQALHRSSDVGENWQGKSHAHFVERNVELQQFVCHFHAQLWEGSNQPADANVSIRLDLDLLYNLDGINRWTDEQLDVFASTSSELQAWPYWREFAQSAGSRLHVPVPMVGVAPIAARRNRKPE